MSDRTEKQKEHAAETAEVERVQAGAERARRPEWTSERAFVLSTAAAGVGLGNLWRFPYVLGDNGGAAFLIAYLLAMAAVAVPFAALEIAAGRVTHGSAVTTFRRLARPAAVYGWGVVLLTLVIGSYYFVVSGWTLAYAGHSLTGSVPSFDTFAAGWGSVWALGAICVMVGVVLALGLSGIERFAKVLMPVLVLTVLGLAVYAMIVGDRGRAISFLFGLEPAALARPEVWAAAFGQAFYSLAIGQGYLITYGSYLPREVRVARSIAIVAAVNVTVALLAGFMIFPLVFGYDLSPAAGSDLAFEVLPQAFGRMTAGGVVAALFFCLFFLAAFSSCIAGAKVVAAALRDGLSFGNRASVLATIAAIGILGLPSALSYAAPGWTIAGTPVLDAVDQVAGSGAVLASGLIGAAILAWRLSRQRWQTVMGGSRPAVVRFITAVGRWAPVPVAGVLAAKWIFAAG